MAPASISSAIKRIVTAATFMGSSLAVGAPALASAWDLPPPPPPSASLALLGGNSQLLETWKSQGIVAQSSPSVAATAPLEPTADRSANSLIPYRPSEALARTSFSVAGSRAGGPDVFGSVAMAIASTPYDAMWRRAAFSNDSSVRRWSATFDRGSDRARLLREVNKWVNHRVAFTEDAVGGVSAEIWQSAEESLRRSRGDCEDYALAKLALLAALGVERRDLYLVIARDLIARGNHAVLAVRTEAGFVILDNATDELIEGDRVNDYRPIFSYSAQGRWIHGYADRRPASTVIQIASAASAITAP